MTDPIQFELLNIFLQKAQEKLRKISPQLYLFDEFFPKPYASSVLVKVKERKFLITAAHILAGTTPGQIQIGYFNEFITPLNDWHFHIDTNLDLAVMEISGELEKGLTKNFEFYDLGLINPDHEILMSQIFFSFGYPATKTKVVTKLKKVQVGALVFSTELQDHNICFDLGFHPNTHLVLTLDKKVRSSNTHYQVHPPLQHGMSGCGIWHIPTTFFINPDIDEVPLILSGIYIEFHKKKSSIVATRTLILTELLRRHFKCDLKPTKMVRFEEE